MTNPPNMLELIPGLQSGLVRRARFSEDRMYRYDLERVWDEHKPPCTFVMLNPSYANEDREDNTVSRCIKFAKLWGCGRLHVANLFALVSTDPGALYEHPYPIGPDNDDAIVAAARSSKLVVAAWGAHGAHMDRASEVRKLIEPIAPLVCLGLTKDGYPKHPLARGKSFVPYEFEPIPLAEALMAWSSDK